LRKWLVRCELWRLTESEPKCTLGTKLIVIRGRTVQSTGTCGTDQQICAGREALERFEAAEGFQLGRVFVEVETGKGSDALDRRPQLAAALNEARASVALWPLPTLIA
jgi:hypothetical protein